MPRGGPRDGAGRKPGSPNKKTIARAEAAAVAVEAARASGKKLAVDVLDDFMQLFAGLSAHHQPLPPGMPIPPGREPNESKFEKYARLALDAAGELAQYQSPKYAAIRLHTVPPPGTPGAAQMAQPGDGARVVEGRVTRIDDPSTLVRVYRDIMARPKTAR